MQRTDIWIFLLVREYYSIIIVFIDSMYTRLLLERKKLYIPATDAFLSLVNNVEGDIETVSVCLSVRPK